MIENNLLQGQIGKTIGLYQVIQECMGKVFDLAVILCSSFEEQIKEWSVELDSSCRPKAKDDGYFKAVWQLVNACVGTYVIEGAS